MRNSKRISYAFFIQSTGRAEAETLHQAQQSTDAQDAHETWDGQVACEVLLEIAQAALLSEKASDNFHYQ